MDAAVGERLEAGPRRPEPVCGKYPREALASLVTDNCGSSFAALHPAVHHMALLRVSWRI